MRLSIYLTLPLCLLILNCATQPKVKVLPNSNIGILSLIDQKAKHSHEGTTVFNLFHHDNLSDWNMEETLINYIKEQLTAEQSFIVFEIEQTPILMEKRFDLWRPGWSKTYLKKKYIPEIMEAAKGQNIDFIAILQPIIHSVFLNDQFKANGYGLATKCLVSICSAECLTHVVLNIYKLDSRESVTKSTIAHYKCPIDIDWSKDIKNLPTSEIDKAKKSATLIIKKRIHKALITSGLISE